MALSHFSPHVRNWFTAAFERPTAAQLQAWPAIATGNHVLISAPTGSGKTLAAFLWALDRLNQQQPTTPDPNQARTTRLVYISPLKALSYDIDRNLRTPLQGIGADLKIAIRTGDTPQHKRQAMIKQPPDILITTPESLYLMLTSQAREILRDVETVIVDEVHAVAGNKRGAHLALTLERLTALTQTEIQRIRSLRHPEPTSRDRALPRRPQPPMHHHRRRRATTTRPTDPHTSRIMTTPDTQNTELTPLPGGEATKRSIWRGSTPNYYA